MLLNSLTVDRKAFEDATGWTMKPEGACKGDVCIALPDPMAEQIDVEATASTMGLPLVAAAEHNLWALGPESIGSRALTSAEAPNLRLPDLEGNEFQLSSLRGQKIVVYAWAPY
jgi:hypothetical protein